MSSTRTTPRGRCTLLAFLLAGHAAIAQQAPPRAGEYTPSIGQIGKDVIWVPTPEPLVEQMLVMANVGPDDFVVDLGSGDGRTVIMAAKKFGARGMGIEYNPDLVAYSIRQAEQAGVADRVEFVEADVFETDFRQATVVTMYLLPSLNLKLRPKILALRPGTRVVSNSFDMAEWRPDRTITLGERTAYFWIVPAQVAGDWRLTTPTRVGEQSGTLRIDQEFQILYGRMHLPEGWFDFVDGQIEGTEFQFRIIYANGSQGKVTGHAFPDHLEGMLQNQDGTALSWRAVPAESR